MAQTMLRSVRGCSARWLFIACSGCATKPSAELASSSTPRKGDQSATSTVNTCGRVVDGQQRQASEQPPGNLKPPQVPLFVSLGWDDNGHADGIQWALNQMASHRNPSGQGKSQLYDGTPARATFYLTAKYGENPATLAAWQQARAQGHEIANHTYTHTTGTSTTLAQWHDEIERYEGKMASGLQLACSGIVGFRTPFLAHNAATLQAVSARHYLYDCSLEEGFQANQDGTNFVWPYTLHAGSPGNKTLGKAAIGHHQGLWEMPVYAFVVPPDDACELYGVPRGLREKLKKVDPDFDVGQGKITGFDYNLWYLYRVSGSEALAIWKYSFDLRKRGNRAPFLLGMHTDIYSQVAAQTNGEEQQTNATWQERRKAVQDFLSYVAPQPEVRIVSVLDALRWIQNPTPL